MKKFIQLEPTLRRTLNPKSAKRNSFTTLKKMRNKAMRNALKNNLHLGKEVLKMRYDYEF